MAETRELYRGRSNRQVAGVGGGLVQYFNLDATLIRILLVVLSVLGAPASCSMRRCGSSSPRDVSGGVIQPGTVHLIPVALRSRTTSGNGG
jgi:phage shock protein C